MRMVQALDGIRARHPKQIVAVFSHADIIKLAIAYYVGMHMDLFQRLVINPCSLTAIAFERMGPRLLAFNDTGALEHLRPKPEAPAEAKEPADGAAPADGPGSPDAPALIEGDAPAEVVAGGAPA